jgi:hypothetical protein
MGCGLKGAEKKVGHIHYAHQEKTLAPEVGENIEIA